MMGEVLNEDESRIAIAGLQMLERDLAVQLELRALQQSGTPGAVPHNIRDLLDCHDAVAALTIKLTTGGSHWMDVHEIDIAKQGLDRYVTILANSIAAHEYEKDDFLLEPELRRRQSELAKSSALLMRFERI